MGENKLQSLSESLGITAEVVENQVEVETKEQIIEQPAEKVEEQPSEKQTEQPAEQPAEQPKDQLELNDELVSKYLSEKYKKEVSLDDAFNTEKVIEEKVVNPYEDVMDDTEKAFFDFKRKTNLGRKEWDFLQQDISKKSNIELAIEKVRSESDVNLSDNQIKEYLEKKLDIELSEEELSPSDLIELSRFSKPFKDRLLKQQDEYKKPLDNIIEKKSTEKVEMVTLENGSKMPKKEYDQLVSQRNDYKNSLKEAVNNVATFDVKTVVDVDGEKKEVMYSYEVSDDDRHSMLSDAEDVNATIQKLFKKENGFDHKGLTETLWRGQDKNFNKVVSALIVQAKAEAIEEYIANNNNENFTRESIKDKGSSNDGYGSIV